METCGVWFEEAAPTSLMVQSSGIDRESWGLAISSQRVPSHCHPAILTENYPDEDHWTWQRFVVNREPGTAYFRVPPGERADATQRAEWQEALKDRPDLARRLLDGQPGVVLLGDQVAVGFNEDRHVVSERIKPIAREPLFIGQDFGHTPTTVIGQQYQGYVRVLASLTIERGGVKQLIEYVVKPWLVNNAPWALRDESMIIGGYDESAADEQTDIEQNPAKLLRELIPGYWTPISNEWEGRKGPLLAIMNRAVGGLPALQCCPVNTKGLVKALSGRWYYKKDRQGGVIKDKPEKGHPWSDYGDAFCYMLCAMGISSGIEQPAKPIEVFTGFDARNQPDVVRPHQIQVRTLFDARR